MALPRRLAIRVGRVAFSHGPAAYDAGLQAESHLAIF